LIEINEFLDATNLRSQQSYSFEDALACLSMCRKSEGFSAQEYAERIATYNKFDVEEEGEITTLQVLDLLRYLGYQVQVEDVERYANEVDFNGNGTMDVNEYLRLMRLHLEDEFDSLDRVFRLCERNAAGCLPLDQLHEALQESNCCPSHCDVFDELGIDANTVGVSFDEFKDLSKRCRILVKDKQRKKANFSDDEVVILRKTFQWHDLQGKGVLGTVPLSNLLHECGVPLHTADLRKKALELLDRARQAALDSDVPSTDVGEFGGFSATFWVMVHAWRLIARENESKCVARLDTARETTGFAVSEVTEFQEIFNDRIKREREGDTAAPAEEVNQGRRRSMPELQGSAPQMAQDTAGKQEQVATLESIIGLNHANEQLPFEGLKKLLGHLKLKLSPKNAHALHEQLQTITGDDEGNGMIDIAGFLYLMRWMLETNFANLNDKNANTAKSATSPSASEAKKKTIVTPMPLLPSTKFCRRASI